MWFLARTRLGRCMALAAALCAAAASAAPALPYGAPVAARFAEPSQRYATPAFDAGRVDFTDNDELAEFVGRIARAGHARLIEAGRSGAGEPILALHFSRGAGRPAVLLVGQQHGNEPAGSEALLAVAAALADARSPLAEVLASIDVVLLPRANPDGTRLARRTNAQGQDVNRDHLLLATAEARAIARLALAHSPLLVVDVHEHLAMSRGLRSIGAVARHDLLVQYATTPNLVPSLVRASEAWFRAPMQRELEREGLSLEWYHVATATERHFAMGGVQPALARNAFGLRHAVSVLLESRGMDLGRLHFARRVHAHVVALGSLLRSASVHAAALSGLQAEAGAAQSDQACKGPLTVDAQPTTTRREMLVIDAESGADRVVDVGWESALELRALSVRTRPCAYWLDAGATDAVERLRALGVKVQVLDAPKTVMLQRYRETARNVAGEAPTPVRVTVELDARQMALPAGSHLVPMDQPLAALAAAALEPDTAHSFVAHGLLTLAQLARLGERP